MERLGTLTTDTEQRLRDLAPFYFHRLATIEVDGDGWTGLLEEVIAEAKLRNLDGFSFSQIKEKMGELRIYVNMSDDVPYEDFRSFHNYLGNAREYEGSQEAFLSQLFHHNMRDIGHLSHPQQLWVRRCVALVQE
jgi:hypothetical protein